MGTFSRFALVAVEGASMEPTYKQGDWLFVRAGNRGRRNDCLVIERDERPGIYLIKRLIRIDQDRYWVEGDNKAASTDSRQWGAISRAQVKGKVLFRYRKAR